MFEKKKLLVGIIGVVLGFVVIQQFYLHNKISQTVQPENENNLALEVSELIKTNEDLSQEVKDLTAEHDNLSRSAEDAAIANATLEDNLKKDEIILGLTDVKGEGVEINFDNKISSTELIDLLNAIKNIGADAIQINDQRLTMSTYIKPGFFNAPTVIKVIGDKNLLYDSLVRPGGILDQIGFGKVSKLDQELIVKKK